MSSAIIPIGSFEQWPADLGPFSSPTYQRPADFVCRRAETFKRERAGDVTLRQRLALAIQQRAELKATFLEAEAAARLIDDDTAREFLAWHAIDTDATGAGAAPGAPVADQVDAIATHAGVIDLQAFEWAVRQHPDIGHVGIVAIREAYLRLGRAGVDRFIEQTRMLKQERAS